MASPGWVGFYRGGYRMRRFLSLFTRKPSPSPQVLDVAAAKRRAEQREAGLKGMWTIERKLALAELKDAKKKRQTQRQHKAAKRVRRATDRCLELGV